MKQKKDQPDSKTKSPTTLVPYRNTFQTNKIKEVPGWRQNGSQSPYSIKITSMKPYKVRSKKDYYSPLFFAMDERQNFVFESRSSKLLPRIPYSKNYHSALKQERSQKTVSPVQGSKIKRLVLSNAEEEDSEYESQRMNAIFSHRSLEKASSVPLTKENKDLKSMSKISSNKFTEKFEANHFFYTDTAFAAGQKTEKSSENKSREGSDSKLVANGKKMKLHQGEKYRISSLQKCQSAGYYYNAVGQKTGKEKSEMKGVEENNKKIGDFVGDLNKNQSIRNNSTVSDEYLEHPDNELYDKLNFKSQVRINPKISEDSSSSSEEETKKPYKRACLCQNHHEHNTEQYHNTHYCKKKNNLLEGNDSFSPKISARKINAATPLSIPSTTTTQTPANKTPENSSPITVYSKVQKKPNEKNFKVQINGENLEKISQSFDSSTNSISHRKTQSKSPLGRKGRKKRGKTYKPSDCKTSDEESTELKIKSEKNSIKLDPSELDIQEDPSILSIIQKKNKKFKGISKEFAKLLEASKKTRIKSRKITKLSERKSKKKHLKKNQENSKSEDSESGESSISKQSMLKKIELDQKYLKKTDQKLSEIPRPKIPLDPINNFIYNFSFSVLKAIKSLMAIQNLIPRSQRSKKVTPNKQFSEKEREKEKEEKSAKKPQIKKIGKFRANKPRKTFYPREIALREMQFKKVKVRPKAPIPSQNIPLAEADSSSSESVKEPNVLESHIKKIILYELSHQEIIVNIAKRLLKHDEDSEESSFFENEENSEEDELLDEVNEIAFKLQNIPNRLAFGPDIDLSIFSGFSKTESSEEEENCLKLDPDNQFRQSNKEAFISCSKSRFVLEDVKPRFDLHITSQDDIDPDNQYKTRLSKVNLTLRHLQRRRTRLLTQPVATSTSPHPISPSSKPKLEFKGTFEERVYLRIKHSFSPKY